MAPPLPATLVHCAVFSTSSRARRQRSPGPGTTAREHCRLASCKAVFVVLPLSWWRSQRPGRASPLPPVPPWSLMVSQCFWAGPSLSPPSTAFFRLPLQLARLATHHAHAGGPRQSSHSACAAAPGLAQSGSPYWRLRSLLYAIIVRLLRDRMARTCRAQPKKVKRV